jgi:hypothetical protein
MSDDKIPDLPDLLDVNPAAFVLAGFEIFP